MSENIAIRGLKTANYVVQATQKFLVSDDVLYYPAK